MKLFPEQNTLHGGKMRTTIFDIQRCSFVDGPGIRTPVFFDDIEEIIKISEFLKDIHYSYIEILPYHKMGEHKYEALGIKCFEYAIPEKENIEKYKKILNI